MSGQMVEIKNTDENFAEKCHTLNKVTSIFSFTTVITGQRFRAIMFEPLGVRYMRVRVMDEEGFMMRLDLPRAYKFEFEFEV